MRIERVQCNMNPQRTKVPIPIHPEETNKFQLVPSENVDKLLVLYPQDERIIKNCRYMSGELLANLIPRDIEYSIACPDYYTANQLVHAVSQMGYVLGGMAILDDYFEDLPKWSFEPYLECLRKLKCFYLNLNLSFKKKLEKREDYIIKMFVYHALCTNTRILTKVKASVEGLFVADATFYVPFF